MPVCQLFEQDLMLVASPRLAVTDVEGLIAAARAAPGTVTIGHYGPASATHLELIGFTRATGINVVAVPYRSHGQLMADLASGALQAAFTTPGSFDPTVIRGLALISDAPNPGVPTTAAWVIVHSPCLWRPDRAQREPPPTSQVWWRGPLQPPSPSPLSPP